MLSWLILHCACSLHSYLFLKGSPVDPRLRALREQRKLLTPLRHTFRACAFHGELRFARKKRALTY
jgi:hypothetical protein